MHQPGRPHAVAFVAALASYLFVQAAAAGQPPAPYYSIDLGRVRTQAEAAERLSDPAPPDPYRAEQRRTGWYLRAGAFATRAEAEAALKALANAPAGARVIRLENPAPWLVASGEMVAVPGAEPEPAAEPQIVPLPKPVPLAVAPEPAPEPAAGTAPDGAATAAPDQDLTSLDLTQLMAMEVTGITRRAGSYARAPAALYVLTGEDIRRSGVRTLADALRLVPGLQVVRSTAQGYTVTARGFGGDKLQVLLDDRSVYTPLNSTVFWDVFDTYLEDVARIEVIRGPGAAVYGANAVNGVINIVTRPAGDSSGMHLYAGGGEEEKAFGGFRSGGSIGEWGQGRAYVRARERDSTDRSSGDEATDGQTQVQAGGRIDGSLGSLGTLTLQGDVYQADSYSATFPGGALTDTETRGRNLGLRWTYGWSGGGQTLTSAYYDGYNRYIPTIFGERRDTWDLGVQHNFSEVAGNRVTAGVGARVSRDETEGAPAVVVFAPADTTHRTYSGFLQDELALGDFSLVGSAKIEHNDFSGTEFQPGLRLGWAATEDVFTWAAVSRATRTPNRLDHDTGIVCSGVDTPFAGCPGAGAVLPVGSKNFDSEKLIAYEWGLRSQLQPGLLADLALFFNDYADLRSSEPPFQFANNIEAESYGGELSVNWEPVHWIHLAAFYAYLEIDARADPSSTDTTTANTLENGTGEQSAGLRIGVQPAAPFTVDTFVRFVDNTAMVPTYTELNLRLGWAVTPLLELALVGENLLDASHVETGTNTATRSEIPRSLFAELAWRWQ